jgi:hypothetical protein
MRRKALLASLLLATPALAQEEPPPAAEPAAQPAATEEPAEAAKPAEAVPRAPSSHPTPPAVAPAGTDAALLDAVSRFFGALREGDAAGIAAASTAPFRLEAEDLRGTWEVRRRFGEILASRPLAHVPLYGIELLTAAEMKARHGAPPARLGALPLEGAHVAIANFGGKAVVAVFRAEGKAFRAVAFTE